MYKRQDNNGPSVAFLLKSLTTALAEAGFTFSEAQAKALKGMKVNVKKGTIFKKEDPPPPPKPAVAPKARARATTATGAMETQISGAVREREASQEDRPRAKAKARPALTAAGQVADVFGDDILEPESSHWHHLTWTEGADEVSSMEQDGDDQATEAVPNGKDSVTPLPSSSSHNDEDTQSRALRFLQAYAEEINAAEEDTGELEQGH